MAAVIAEADVHGYGAPIRDFFPGFHKNYKYAMPSRNRTAVMPYYACSISDKYLTMLDSHRRSERAGARIKIARITERDLPIDYDVARLFYGEFVKNRFSFVGNETKERSQLLQEMLVRAFDHSAICVCFQNIRTMNPNIYFGENLLGALGSIIDRLSRSHG
jgi:hypothetical protein